MSHLEPLMQKNFLEYASYVIVDRAIPDIRDGCKPVQRRILATLADIDDGKFHKVANVIGETMKLHPHGDASIGDALVVLANKEYFIEKQGNFGNPLTGHAAAAARYVECRLTELARETLFNKALTTFRPSYDGRKQEPEFLPVKLPVTLMLGAEGIAVGMATKLLPHNFNELLTAQIALLNGKKASLFPDFPQGGVMDVSDYEDGRGKVRVRAKLEPQGDKKIIIREIPYGTTTESLLASIESAAQKNKVKISSINDFTTDRVEIELILTRGIYVDEVLPQLYACTDCEVSVSSNIVVIRDRRPAELTVTEVLEFLTERLREQIRAELQHELGQLEDKQHWLTLEQIFIENRVYKKIERATTAESVTRAVCKGMEPFAHLFVRDMTEDDVERLLGLRIRRISAFDINKHRQEIDDIVRAIKRCRTRLKQLTRTTVSYLEGIIKKYGKLYPRRTRIETFEQIDRKAVARENLKLCYDAESGFFGTEVRGKDKQFTVSEYGLVLVVCRDGTFRVLTPQPKVLLPSEVLCMELFDPGAGKVLTVVYRDKQRYAFCKKVHIQKFIRNKEYMLFKDKAGQVEQLFDGDVGGIMSMRFLKGPRQKVLAGKFDLAEVEIMGLGARGMRMATKQVVRMTYAEPK